MKLLYQLDGGLKPTKAHASDAGYDLYCIEKVLLKAGEVTCVDTHVRILIPEGFVGLILPRSGLSSYGVSVSTGVIDAGYTGKLKVAMSCLTGTFELNAGSRVAQIVLMPLANFQLEESDLSVCSTYRGERGFGSSGF